MIIKRKIAVAIALNSVIVIVTTAVILSFFLGNKDAFIRSGPQSFRFFTTDSNVLSMIGSMIMIPFEVRALRGKAEKLPRFAIVIKYVCTASVTLTFFTVMLFLGPTFGYPLFLNDTGIFTHLISPMLAFYTFTLLETNCEISFKNVLWALVPTLIYGTVYLTQVLVVGEKNGGWEDFYFFNTGGYWYMSSTVMFIASILINLLLKSLHNNTYKKYKLPEKSSPTVFEW
ncbi:MAG: hypothetical protein K6F88_00200 [Ruminococcus sp.]|nr:hypothetical protein [Ruminococcus sp.]